MGCGGSKSGEVNQTTPPAAAPVANTRTRYGNGRYDEDNLPDPTPPKQSRDELLHGQHESLKRADQRAMNAYFDDAVTQELNRFTVETLIPKDLVTETQTISILPTSATVQMNQGNKNEPVHGDNGYSPNGSPHADAQPLIYGTTNGDGIQKGVTIPFEGDVIL